MKNVSLVRTRVQVATKVSGLLVLVFVVIAFFATPSMSLAHDTGSGSGNSSSTNVAAEKQGRLGLLGKNGCLNKQNRSRQDIANCLGLPDFSNLTSLCGNDASNVAPGTNQQDIANCLGIPDLSNLTSLCEFLGIGNNNPNDLAAGTNQQDIANCLGIPDLSNLPSLSRLLGRGNNPNDLAARVRASGKQSSLPVAKLAGILQFTTVQAGGRQTTSQAFAAQQGGGTPKFRIVPAQAASIGKGDFIGAYFNGKLESGVGLGAGRADLFDPVTSQLITVQLS